MSKVKIKTDIEGQKNRKYNFYDMTTLSFFRPQVVRAIEFQPGVNMNLANKDLLLLKPMVVPIKGNMKLKHFFYFVPFRQVQRSWNSFINGELHYYENSASIPTQTRMLSLKDLYDIFTYNAGGIGTNEYAYEANTAEQNDSNWKPDFRIWDTTHSIGVVQMWKWRFTKKGRWLFSLLHTLGYIVPFGIDRTKLTTYKSALPLLCLAKMYLDHMKNTAYNNYVKYNSVEIIINRNADNNQNLDIQDVTDIVEMLYNVNYDTDLWVSVFDNPVGPNGGNNYITNQYRIDDNTVNLADSHKSTVVQDTNGTPRIIRADNNNENATSLSKYMINALQRLSDFMHRHQIVGHDKLNAYLAQFGVSLSDEQLNVSKYLGKSEQEIVVDQIFSTSDTASANLGAFAGRGYAVNQGGTKLSTNEFGMFFDIALIVPKIGYYQGEKRHISHINRLDFWNPTFDGMGNAAVSQSEILVSLGLTPNATTLVNTDNFNQVFGFLPRYYEYKEYLSDLGGDFLCNSTKNEMSAWHLFREFEESDFYTWSGGIPSGFDVKHNFNFTEAFDRERYERGFYQNLVDNFILITNHEMDVTSSVKDLYDYYDYDSIGKEFVVDMSGTNKITK